jgi:hypothetical protein
MHDLPCQSSPADRMTLQVQDARQDGGCAPSIMCCVPPFTCACHADEE